MRMVYYSHMKIIGKRTEKRTKLHIHKCVLCGDDFGSYRISSKVCSKDCRISHNREINRRGMYRACKTCGKDFWVKKSEDRRGSVRTYCSMSCQFPNKKLGLPYGEYFSYDGYIVISTLKDGRKQIKKHRFIMENHLGRKLRPDEIVHHINENKIDNRIENLQVVSRSEHNKIHKFLHK